MAETLEDEFLVERKIRIMVVGILIMEFSERIEKWETRGGWRKMWERKDKGNEKGVEEREGGKEQRNLGQKKETVCVCV